MYFGFGLLLLVILGEVVVLSQNKEQTTQPIKIGVITALTGDVAYWGESTKLGAKVAQTDLKKEGIDVEFVFDDAQLDPKLALTAAQKEVGVDRVQAIYSEFNPAAIAVSSFVKDKNILHVYDAAPISPLQESINNYKTFTDFEVGCRKAAELLKSRGVLKVGVLQNALEFGQLCTNGVVAVYGNNALIEKYNPDTTDFRTPLTKMKAADVGAVFVASFSPDQITVLKNMRGIGMSALLVGTTDIATPEVVSTNASLLNHTLIFGLPVVSQSFITKLKAAIPDATITNEQAAGLAYVHLMQIAHAIKACGNNLACERKAMDASKSAPEIGFKGFDNHIATFDTYIEEFTNGAFTPVDSELQ